MSDTLCWKCTRPGTGGCCWDRELKPVPGWTAEPAETDGFQTYHVIRCPEYREIDWAARNAVRIRLRVRPTVRQNGYGLAILTRDMLAYYEREGANLQQIHTETGVPTGVIYARRARLRRRER